MPFEPLPECAAWRHLTARDGFEVAFFAQGDGYRISGHTTAVEAGRPWAVRYELTLDRDWLTRSVTVWGWSEGGHTTRRIEGDGAGTWSIDGSRRPELDGCLDIDLESSAVTNTIPVHRLALDVGASAQAPAAYVRAADLHVGRLDQRYARVPSSSGQAFAYEAPAFAFECRLHSDAAGLVVDYPGLAARVL